MADKTKAYKDRQYFLTQLRGNIARNKMKYERNARAYTNSVGTYLENLKECIPYGLNQIDPSPEDDTSPTPQMNVIKSVIDTLVSKIAAAKVRPYFTPVNGDYQTLKVIRQVQAFFDDYFDRQDITHKVPMAFRDACIFDNGALFVNPFLYTIDRLPPWQYSILDAELQYGILTKLLVRYTDFPVHLVEQIFRVESNQDYYCELEIYFDTIAREYTVICDKGEKKTGTYNGPIPVVLLHYVMPMKGNRATSIVDDLYNIQDTINQINSRINDAAQLNPAQTIILPEGNNVNVETLNNRVGNVIRYRPTPTGTTPIQVMTPEFISRQYVDMLEYYISKAYEMVGVSQLSAQSENPLGAGASGFALNSMENIESTRFEVQLNQVIRAYVDLARRIIEVYPDEATVLPDDAMRAKFTWKDVRKQIQLVNVQYSAQTILSKDPATRFKQILELSQVNMIKPSKVARFLDQPDLNEVYTLATAAQDAVDRVIQRAIEEEIYDIPKFVSYQLLEEEITAMQNQLMAVWSKGNREVEKNLDSLQMLDDNLQIILKKEGFTQIDPGEAQVSEGGIASGGIVEAPSSTDAAPGQMDAGLDDTPAFGAPKDTEGLVIAPGGNADGTGAS